MKGAAAPRAEAPPLENPRIAPASPQTADTSPPTVAGPVPLAYETPRSSRKSRPARHVSDNPILWREIRRPLFARRWQRVTAACICIGMLLIIYALLGSDHDLNESSDQAGWACIFNFLISGILLVIASTAIAQEKESDTWTLLLATPVAGATIVWGKALGVFRRMFWPMVLVAVHFILFALCDVISFSAAFATIWIIISFNVIWIATGVYFSLRFSKTTPAVIANLLLAVAAYVFVYAALGMASELHFDPSYYPRGLVPPWLGPAAISFFVGAVAWWIAAVVQSAWRSRGALGQLMLASLTLFVAAMIFASRNAWVTGWRLERQVGWYTPYYYLAQIGRRRHEFEIYSPNRTNSIDDMANLGFLFMLGLAQIILAGIVLWMTSWKFSALVGRAPQTKPLAATDRQPARAGLVNPLPT